MGSTNFGGKISKLTFDPHFLCDLHIPTHPHIQIYPAADQFKIHVGLYKRSTFGTEL